MSVGVILNPLSLHGARLGSTLRGLDHAEPTSMDELASALADFARRERQIVAVAGGDGTLRAVMTQLRRFEPDYRPALAVLPVGKVNLVARALGPPGRTVEEFSSLLRAGRLRVVEQSALDLDGGGLQLRGFLLGAAAFTWANRVAEQRIHPSGLHHGMAVGATMIAALAQLALNRDGTLRDGEWMSLAVDDRPPECRSRFLVLVSTLDRLMLGLRPFWDADGAPIRWLDVAAPPRRLYAALLPILTGRPRPWMWGAGYASGGAHRLRIEASAIVLDGDPFHLAGPVEISASPVRLLVP